MKDKCREAFEKVKADYILQPVDDLYPGVSLERFWNECWQARQKDINRLVEALKSTGHGIQAGRMMHSNCNVCEAIKEARDA